MFLEMNFRLDIFFDVLVYFLGFNLSAVNFIFIFLLA